MFNLYYKIKIWKLKRDIKFYKQVTGEVNTYKQQELNYYLKKLNK